MWAANWKWLGTPDLLNMVIHYIQNDILLSILFYFSLVFDTYNPFLKTNFCTKIGLLQMTELCKKNN